MHVNQLAKALKTTPDTVRYYTRIGLLRPRKDEHNAYKCYDEDDKKRLCFILCARQMDFTIDEIAQIFARAEQEDSCCSEVMALIKQRLDEIQQRLALTVSLKSRLRTALSEWQSQPQPPTGSMLNDVISNFGELS